MYFLDDIHLACLSANHGSLQSGPAASIDKYLI